MAKATVVIQETVSGSNLDVKLIQNAAKEHFGEYYLGSVWEKLSHPERIQMALRLEKSTFGECSKCLREIEDEQEHLNKYNERRKALNLAPQTPKPKQSLMSTREVTANPMRTLCERHQVEADAIAIRKKSLEALPLRRPKTVYV